MTRAARPARSAWKGPLPALGGLVLVAVLATCCVRHGTRTMDEGRGRSGGSEDRRAEGPPSGSRPSLRPAGIGTNVTGISDWTTQDPFLDVFKRSRRFVSGTGDTWTDGRELALNQRHELQRLEPGQVARTVLLTDHGRYPGGQYVLTYRGEAEFHFDRPVVSRQPGRIVLDVPAPERPEDETALLMNILAVNPDDPIRDMHVYPPLAFCADDRLRPCEDDDDCAAGGCTSFEEASRAGELFRPRFIADLAPYGMLRFMDWGQTNNSTVREWDERAKLDDASYAHAGVPLERMIELANRSGAQPWFCIPHLASDDYVQRFAELVEAELDPALPVWIEYSNEVWNGIFHQARDLEERGETLGLGEGMEARLRYQGARSAEIFELVDAVLGTDRVVRVLATQADWPELASWVIEGAEGRADALAVAPYVGLMPGPDEARRVVAGGLAELERRSREEVLAEMARGMREHAAIARRHGLDLVAYEGGQHFLGADEAVHDGALNALFDRFNRAPAMGRLYTAMLEQWVSAGGGWFNHFVDVSRFGQWGRWGAREFAGQPRVDAPKYDALLRFRDAHPRGW
ncbi:MAG: hypothetical protein AAF447_09990 [Myxococcota bacterium]